MTDAEEISKVFAAFVPRLRYPIKGLVACAGVSDNAPAVDFPVESFRRLLDINVTGTFLVARAVAREMIQAKVSGSVVLVASMSGYVSNKVSGNNSTLLVHLADRIYLQRALILLATTLLKQPFTSSLDRWLLSGALALASPSSVSIRFHRVTSEQLRQLKPCRSREWNLNGSVIICCTGSAPSMSFAPPCFTCWATVVAS